MSAVVDGGKVNFVCDDILLVGAYASVVVLPHGKMLEMSVLRNLTPESR